MDFYERLVSSALLGAALMSGCGYKPPPQPVRTERNGIVKTEYQNKVCFTDTRSPYTGERSRALNIDYCYYKDMPDTDLDRVDFVFLPGRKEAWLSAHINVSDKLRFDDKL